MIKVLKNQIRINYALFHYKNYVRGHKLKLIYRKWNQTNFNYLLSERIRNAQSCMHRYISIRPFQIHSPLKYEFCEQFECEHSAMRRKSGRRPSSLVSAHLQYFNRKIDTSLHRSPTDKFTGENFNLAYLLAFFRSAR